MEDEILGWVNTELGFKQLQITSVEDLFSSFGIS